MQIEIMEDFQIRYANTIEKVLSGFLDINQS